MKMIPLLKLIVLIIAAIVFSPFVKAENYFDEVAITIPYDISIPSEYTSARVACNLANVISNPGGYPTVRFHQDAITIHELFLESGRAKGELVYGYGPSATNVSGTKKHFTPRSGMDVFESKVRELFSKEVFNLRLRCRIFELRISGPGAVRLFDIKYSPEHSEQAIFETDGNNETFVRTVNGRISWNLSITPALNNNQGSIEDFLLDFGNDEDDGSMIFDGGNG